MSDQDRFKEIAKVAVDATETVIVISKKLGEDNIVMSDLSDLAYQLGYIEGLSYVSEEKE